MALNPAIRDMIHEVLKEDLSLKIEERDDGSLEIQLKLADENIGNPIFIGLTYDRDHRHNFDHVTDMALTGD